MVRSNDPYIRELEDELQAVKAELRAVVAERDKLRVRLRAAAADRRRRVEDE